jgi:hypothetical protein
MLIRVIGIGYETKMARRAKEEEDDERLLLF